MSEAIAPLVRWRLLTDPTTTAVQAASPVELSDNDLRALSCDRERSLERVRPRAEVRGDDYVFVQLVLPVVVCDEDRVYSQVVQAVLAPAGALLVATTPEDGAPFEATELWPDASSDAVVAGAATHVVAERLLDVAADRFLRVVADLLDEVEEAEDLVDELADGGPRRVGEASVDPARRIRGLRRDLIDVRRLLFPTREALQGIICDRVELECAELFDEAAQGRLRDVDAKLLRAFDSLDTARELVAGLKDHFVSIESHRQNQVVNRLTVVASLLLLPTLIAGVFGQNFDGMPGQHWASGFWLSVLAIVVLSSAQLLVFHWLGWIDLLRRRRS